MLNNKILFMNNLQNNLFNSFIFFGIFVSFANTIILEVNTYGYYNLIIKLMIVSLLISILNILKVWKALK